MPELPEVETIARGLSARLVGRTIQSAVVMWPRTVAVPSVKAFVEGIAGHRVMSVGRRGKHIVMDLSPVWLLVHLMMSGRLRLERADEPHDSHVRLVLGLDNGWELRFHDVRKFGRVYLVNDPDQVIAGLGPEPLDERFSLAEFQRLLARRRGRLKSLLLNQAFLAGLGNIYADEALFLAGLHPLRSADSMTTDEQARLYQAIRSVLRRAIAARGTTLDDSGYVDLDGRGGGYREEIAVYGRKGQPCLRCSASIERIVVGGRSTHYCPQCQELGLPAVLGDPAWRHADPA